LLSNLAPSKGVPLKRKGPNPPRYELSLTRISERRLAIPSPEIANDARSDCGRKKPFRLLLDIFLANKSEGFAMVLTLSMKSRWSFTFSQWKPVG
jgi:hypothetical protein